MAILRTPSGRAVKVIERGGDTPVVFLHSGVGSAGEWREVFSLWPEGSRLIAVEAYRGGDGPGVPGQRTLDDYADQVQAVVDDVGGPVHLVGFSWGGTTGLHMAVTRPEALASLTVVEPEAYSLLRGEQPEAFAEIAELRDRWRQHVGADRWYEAFEEFVDFYNGPGSFACWPADRREDFLDAQRTRGDLWDVLLDAPLTAAELTTVAVPVHLVEGSATTAVDHAICEVILRRVPRVEHTVIEGAGHMMPLTHAEDLAAILVAGVTRAAPAPDAEEGALDSALMSNAVRVRKALETVFSDDHAQLEDFYDPGFEDHVNRKTFVGIEGITRSTALNRSLLSDLDVEIEHQLAEGDLVATRWVMRGSHRGRKIGLPGVSVHRFEGEKIVECWDTIDSTELIRQLGVWRSTLMFVTEWRALLDFVRA